MENTLTLGMHHKSHLAVAATISIYILIFWLALPAFLLAVGYRLDSLVPIELPGTPAAKILGWSLTVAGLALMAVSMGHLWIKGRGLPISHLPPIRFVATGIYRYVRHPIYLGFNTSFAGLAMLLGSFGSLVFSSPLLLAGWIAYARFYEEPALIERFGESYRTYMKTTAIFIPKRIEQSLRQMVWSHFKKFCGVLSTLANRTILVRRGNLIIVTNGLLVAAGTLLFIQHSSTLFIIQGVQKSHIISLHFGNALAASFFGYLFWWIGHCRELVRQPLLGTRNIGFVSYGAFFGLIVSSGLFSLLYGYPILMMTDVVIRGLFINYAIGRIGCLTYGCCWGRATSLFGVLYENPQAKVLRLTGRKQALCYPTQVYSSLEGLTLFMTLNILSVLPLPAGFLTALALLVYSIIRMFLEFYRERRFTFYKRFHEGHLSCAIVFLIGLILFFSLSPAVTHTSPKPWNTEAFVQSLSLAPFFLLIVLLVFVVAGVHWRKVGTW